MWKGLFSAACAAALLTLSASGSCLPLQKIVAKAKPSVVHLAIVAEDGEELGSGSGFVISESGEVVTNFHVGERYRSTSNFSE